MATTAHYPTQSNTAEGARIFPAGEDLSLMTARLVKLTHDTGAPEVKLPAAADHAPYLLVEGGVDTASVVILPLDPLRNYRAVAKGAANPGDLLVLADESTAADKGKLRVLPAAAGDYRVVGIAEEKAADGTLLLFRPYNGGVITVE